MHISHLCDDKRPWDTYCGGYWQGWQYTEAMEDRRPSSAGPREGPLMPPHERPRRWEKIYECPACRQKSTREADLSTRSQTKPGDPA